MKVRTSGILLHPSCLPSAYGIGDLGPSAYRFVDWLAQSGQSFWQMLPLNPTDPGHGHSPYHSASAFAGNPLLISPELLEAEGLLDSSELNSPPDFPSDRVRFSEVSAYKQHLFELAFQRFSAKAPDADFMRFCSENPWLEDYALFAVFRKNSASRPWDRWPEEIRNRRPEAIQEARERYRSDLQKHRFLQFLFFRQWEVLRRRCHRRRIQIIGDIPIYVPFDSADVWANPHLFQLNQDRHPEFVSGVPPDYFSETGQLWGHPLYHWDRMREEDYGWWMWRIDHNRRLFDVVRVDHFRGLVGYWAVPAGSETAQNGRWVEAPAEDFFTRMLRRFGALPLIAEDLGTITPDVREVIQKFSFPGMRVLQFAFGDDFPHGTHLPHLHEKHCVAYTGTHDNNTARGWFEVEAGPQMRESLFRYLGRRPDSSEIAWEMIRLAMMSVASTAIFPIQDVCNMGSEARLNKPATAAENWRWRLAGDRISPDISRALLEVTQTYGRI